MAAPKVYTVLITTRLTPNDNLKIENLLNGRKRKRSALVRYLIQKGLQEVERLQHSSQRKIG
jgi:metal-responsive CopG/Arc/MetJ family transcriptional regulator